DYACCIFNCSASLSTPASQREPNYSKTTPHSQETTKIILMNIRMAATRVFDVTTDVLGNN
ncbi:hypothetical protein KDM87_08680, partial [Undibacterium sp. FT147W]